MELKDKRVLVVGLAVSGQPTVETLNRLGARVTVNDLKKESDLNETMSRLSGQVEEWILGYHPETGSGYDLVVLSPGVPTDLPFLERTRQAGTEVIGELELGYRLSRGTFIGITGTNGKTTTTSLIGDIFLRSGRTTEIVGNIGLPVISRALDSTEKTVFVTEISSFQLESIRRFRPAVAAILNVTPDHLNRHKTMENYIGAKASIFMNQQEGDVLVLNYDNPETRQLASEAPGKVRFFSRSEKGPGFTGVDGGWITVWEGAEAVRVCPVESVFMPGNHNLENALAATAVAYYGGVEPSVIAESLREFRGVEHRIEWVAEIGGVTFFNDSKGTNPDASIKAVEAMDGPTVLIAGGMDKGSEFDEFIQSFGDTVTDLVLLGETKEKIREAAYRNNFRNVALVDTMDEAVPEAWRRAVEGGNVLLSPACASWDMYPNYEIRGRHFKDCVEKLGVDAS